MKKISWYFNRLTRMRLREVPYRVQQASLKWIDKTRVYAFNPAISSTYKLLDLPAIFQLSDHYLDQEQFIERYPNAKDKILSDANEILKNRFNIFGSSIDFGEKIDWHLDPKTKKRWPLRFWGDIDIRDGVTVGGVKFVWEVNRFYFLIRLGLAFWLTGNTKYANKIISIIEDWLEDNPYPVGVNWSSGIECGLRISNLVWALSFLKEYAFSDDDKILLSKFVFIHARRLYRYPSKYSSNNNHALAEGFGLFLAGLYFSHLPGSNKWFQYGKALLEREVSRQILPDGGSAEYTVTYLSFVFDFFLLFKIVCDKNRIPYTEAIDKRLVQSCEFIHSLMDHEGNLPNIGDQDSAVLVNFGLNNWENFKSVLNTGAVLFTRPDFFVGNPDVKSYLLLGERLIKERKRKAESSKPKSDDAKLPVGKLFKYSGIAAIKDNYQGKEIHFVGNATAIGMPPLYAHGHLDALSFTLSIDGYEFLVDPGTYLYHSGGKWRRYFRSTAAHNTIRINHTDLAAQTGEFMFGKPYRITELSLNDSEGQTIWRAGHNAYSGLNVPVLHVREMFHDKGSDKFEFVDILTSKGKYFAEQFFHFHPKCSVKIAGHEIVITRNDVCIRMEIDESLEVNGFCGCEDPLLGWYSKEFNQLEKANTLVCSGWFNGDVKIITTLSVDADFIRN